MTNRTSSIYSKDVDTGISVIIGILIIVSCIVNIANILVIIRKVRALRKCNPTQYLLLNTGVSDTLYTMLPMVFACASLANGRRVSTSHFAVLMCNVTGFIFNVTLRVVVLSILGLSVVRLLALRWPMKFKIWMRRANMKVLTCCMWVVPILMSLVPYMKGVLYTYNMHTGICAWSVHEVFPYGKLIFWANLSLVTLPLVVPGTLIVIFYILIIISIIQFMEKHRRSREIRSTNVLLPLSITSMAKSANSKENLAGEKMISYEDAKRKRLSRSTKVTILLITVFILCYLPYWSIGCEISLKVFRTTYLGAAYTADYTIMGLKTIDSKGFSYYIISSYTTILCNAVMNPLIFLMPCNKPHRMSSR